MGSGKGWDSSPGMRRAGWVVTIVVFYMFYCIATGSFPRWMHILLDNRF